MKSNTTKVVILGAGGLAREAYWVFCDVNDKGDDAWEILGFVDEDPANWGKMLCGIPVLGDFEWFENADKNGLEVICAVGRTNDRKSMAAKAKQAGLRFCSVVHPSVKMSRYVDIGVGSVITAGCIITTQVKIGNHVFLNLDTTVGHDVVVEDFVNISPGCHISGNVTVREGADLGTGSVTLQGVTIGRWSRVGAGAVVTKDVADNVTVVGVPARPVNSDK